MVANKFEGRLKKYLGRALLAAAAAAVALLLAEAAIRLIQFSLTSDRNPASPGWNHPRHMIMRDDKLHYTLRPFFEGRQRNPFGDFDVAVMINEQGLRGRDLEFTLEPGKMQVLMLGDSFTFGEGVLYEESYPARVEAVLTSTYHLSVQTHNAGVPGYSLNQSAGRLNALLPVARPGVVTVGWLPWESLREVAAMEYADGWLVPAEDKDLVYLRGNHLFLSSYPKGTWRAEADVWSQSHSLLYFFLRKRLLIYWQGDPTNAWFEEQGRLEIDPDVLEKPLMTLDAMARVCRQNGAQLVLIMIGAPPESAKNISAFCLTSGITPVSLAENMNYPDSPYQPFLFPHDGHFNPAGHEYMAESLAPKLAEILLRAPRP